MRKLLLLTVLSCFFAANAGVLDVRSRIDAARLGERRATLNAGDDNDVTYVGAIIQLADGQTVADLADLGAIVERQRENYVLAWMPADRITELTDRYVCRASLASAVHPVVDRQRVVTGVAAVHAGTGISQAYTGKGVVAALCDLGFDPTHPTFAGRVAQMTVYDDKTASRTFTDNQSAMTTDDADNWHATHVCGIMAGDGAGSQYVGMAPEATIAASLSPLTDFDLLCGIEDAIDLGKERGEPVVVNLSVSSYLGPHDGTDLVNKYLDLLGREAIICFAAGNSGSMKHTLDHTFTSKDDTFGTCFERWVCWDGFDVYGAVDLWASQPGEPFQLQLVAWDQVEKREMYTSPWLGGNDDLEGNFAMETGIDEGWDEAFAGSDVRVGYGFDEASGRYNIFVYFDMKTEAELPYGNHWARYTFGVRMRGAEGQRVIAYGDGIYSFMRHYGVPGFENGISTNSISNLCANQNTISVGSYNGRNTVPSLSEGTITLDFDEDIVSDWSSYGTLIDGRRLPHINAPGNYVMSSLSTAYLSKHPDDIEPNALTVSHDGISTPWLATCGTSMATPCVAGIIALWLQADPTLTVETVRDIAMQTARKDFVDISTDPHWGAGAIDALTGLKTVIKNAGLQGILPDPTDPVVGAYDLMGRPIDPSRASGLHIVRHASGHTTIKNS